MLQLTHPKLFQNGCPAFNLFLFCQLVIAAQMVEKKLHMEAISIFKSFFEIDRSQYIPIGF
jgi:hypothetical protein